MKLNTICVSCMDDDSGNPNCLKCGAPFNPSVANRLLLPPRTVLREQYLIGRALGHGGFGITYLAWDIGLQTRLAVKEYMPAGVADRVDANKIQPLSERSKQDYEWGLERFMEEARVLKKRNHSNIVSLDTVFRDNGTAYLVMEYLEGMTFEEFLRGRGGTVPFEDALRVMLPVMDALIAAHADGVTHRDVSPDNIYITKGGKVKLIDFGAARQALSQKSQKLTVILKSGYTPEEQYRQNGAQGAWTDVYATAATLYRGITGTIPPGSLDRQAADTLEAPSHLGVAIPATAEAALIQALSVKAPDRFQTMAEFKRGLSGSAPAVKAAPITLPVAQAHAAAVGGASTQARALSPLEEKIRKYETVAPSPTAPVTNPPASAVREAKQSSRAAGPLPKWPIAAAAGLLAITALGGVGWHYLHKPRPPQATPAVPAITEWPAQPSNIPQSDAERQRALEAQTQQEQIDAAQTSSAATPEPATLAPKQAAVQPAAQPKAIQPTTAEVKPPEPVAVTPAPIAPPPAPALSYDDKLKQAQTLAGNGEYTEARTILMSATQAIPSDWRAYNELGKLALYHFNEPAHAFEFYRAALGKGGQATLKVSLEHGTGWLSIQKGKAALKDATGAHSFDMTDVQEARRNKTGIVRLGKGRQSFHIRLVSGDNYNLEPGSYEPAEEVDFILSIIGRL